MSYANMIDKIVELVGGPTNIKSSYHCITRLRFKVIDENKVDLDALNEVDGTLSTINAAGQIQVIIGQHVGDVYDEMQEKYHFNTDTALAPEDGVADDDLVDAAVYKREMSGKKVSSNIIDLISGLFTPVLGMMVATGLIKGVNTLLNACGLVSTTDGAYILLNAMGDCFFYFLPIFLGYTAMKKFRGTPALGALMGAALVYPSIVSATSGEVLYTLFDGTLFASPVYLEFFGVPVAVVSYTSTVIPVICITAVAAPLERWLNKRISPLFKSFIVPAVVLFASLLLGFIVIGPVINLVSNLLGAAIAAIYDAVPVVAGFVYGAIIQICVIFGVHWGFVAISVNNLATLGSDPVTICGMSSAFGQAGVVAGIVLLCRNKRLKGIGVSAIISAMVGITEPCIYGVTLQRKKAFAVACVASGLGGAIIGGAGVRQYVYGVNGIFGWMQVIPPTGFDFTVTASIAACVVSFVVALALTIVLWKRLDVELQVA